MTITERPPAPPAAVGLPRHMPALDGLRGLGLVAVFLAHLLEYRGLSDSALDNAVLKILLRGGYAVPAVFTVSGFAAPFAFASLSVWSALLPFTANVMWARQSTIVAVGFARLVPLGIHADPHSRVSRVVCWKPAVRAGLISYAFYVFHQPLLFLIVRAWHLDAQDFPAVAGSHLIGLLVVGNVVGGITAVLSVASGCLFEPPILKLESRF